MKERMHWLETIFILLAAILVVYWEAAFQGIHRLLGTQIDLLPPLIRADIADAPNPDYCSFPGRQFSRCRDASDEFAARGCQS